MNKILLDEVDSTNEYIKRNIDHLGSFDVVQARYQTNGKGRNGHVWNSLQNDNLLFSILIKHSINIISLSQIIALSIIETLHDYGIEALIKWPNDIYVNDDKICGILVETVFSDTLDGIIVGIGLNVNDESHQSMYQTTQKTFDVNLVLNDLYSKILYNYNLLETGNYEDMLKRINELSYLKDKIIDYQNYGKVRFLRLNLDGTITIKDMKNQEFNIIVNEISLGNMRQYL